MIVAREKEIATLQKAACSERSEFIAVYGRRRIGKTYLVREVFDYRFTFQHSGIANKPREEQLYAFSASLKEYGLQPQVPPTNWLEAFELLKDLLRSSVEKKKVIFIDELSWMDTPNCDLIAALESFWNGWASARKDILLIVCASATSWMMKKVIHAHGGLYNRLTGRIALKPFTLHECEQFKEAYSLPFSRDQLIETYMIMGGVPYYWSLLDRKWGVARNVDELFFADNAPLQQEFDYLFSSLFRSPDVYANVIEILGTKKTGMEFSEISGMLQSNQGGKLTRVLQDLENCGFIRAYKPFGKKKRGTLYQLIDSFVLFYYRFLADRPSDPEFWTHQYGSPLINSWRGIAFERVCLWHVPQIKKALGISGIYTEVCSWQCKADSERGIKGAQIDLIIDRADRMLNLCEMKYSSGVFTIDKDCENSLRTKMDSFRLATKTTKGIQLTMVTTHGIVKNSHSGIVHCCVTADDLFDE